MAKALLSSLASIVNKFVFRPFGVRLNKIRRYDQDGLSTVHSCDFMRDPDFIVAYQRGIQAAGEDYQFHWRAYVALWVASRAAQLPGDFVECGVNRGFLSSAIMQYLSWNKLNKKFYLFDTFCGLDESQLNEEEKKIGRLGSTRDYKKTNFELVQENFKEFSNVILVKGSVPSTLSKVDVASVAYLSLDMNCASPEIAAIRHFWPSLVPGAMVLLDDYAFKGFEPQKKAMDQFANEVKIKILSLPTGQGLIIR